MAENKANGFQNGYSPTTPKGVIEAKKEKFPIVQFENEQIVRVINQFLKNAGYKSTAKELEKESGFILEKDTIAKIRSGVLNGNWDEVEKLVKELNVEKEEAIIFCIRRQNFMELIEKKKYYEAVEILQNELAPVEQNTNNLQLLSSLVMCKDLSTIKSITNWDGAEGESRHNLLDDIQKYVPASEMIPNNRLMTLLNQAVTYQRSGCLFHSRPEESDSLYSNHNCGSEKFPIKETLTIDHHDDEVWHISFSNNGKYLASASSDGTAKVWGLEENETVWTFDRHRGPVSMVQWSFDDKYILTCGNDFKAFVWELRTGNLVKEIDRHKNNIQCCVWVPNAYHFITSSSDKNTFLWNIDGQLLYHWPNLIASNIIVTKDSSKMIINDGQKIRFYDYMTKDVLLTIDEVASSISLSFDEKYLLCSTQDSAIHLWNIAGNEIIKSFRGHLQKKFVVRSSFGGTKQDHVISGSEDNNIYVWNINKEEVLHTLEGHTKMVNVVCWNKAHGDMFASASDDGTIKIWT